MASVIDRLSFDPAEAALYLGQSRYMLIRPETLAALSRAAGPKAGEYFFTAGREGGRLAAQNYYQEQNMDPEATVRFMLETGGALGWTKMKLIAFDLEDLSFQIRARSSALDWPGGAGWEFLAGILSGLGEIIFDRTVAVARIPLQESDKGLLYTIRGITE